MSSSSGLPPRHAFDALADLFLTEHLDPEELASFNFESSSEGQSSVQGDSPDSGTNTTSERDDLEIEFQLVGGDHPTNDGESDWEMVGSFGVTEPETTSADEPLPPHERLTSFLVMCHLPVHGRLWLNQIAAGVAQDEGSLAFVRRTAAGGITLDLFETAKPQSTAGTDSWDASCSTEAASFEGVVSQIGDRWGGWLVESTESEVREYLQSLDSSARESTRILLATSVDAAAMVGVYRTLKSILDEVETGVRIGLIFVGSSLEVSRRAFDRLAAAAGGFLNRRIEFVTSIPKMTPIEFSHLGEFACSERDPNEGSAVPRSLLEIVKGIEAAAKTTEGERQDARGPDSAELRDSDEFEEDDERSAQPPELPLDPPSVASPESSDQSSARSLQVECKTLKSKSELEDTSCIGELCRFVPGLTDILARSPKAEAIEVAIDHEGVFHVLGCDQSLVDRSGRHSDVIAELTAVCEWVSDHDSLLRLLRTVPAQIPNSTPARPTVVHLFTSEPKRYRNMMDGRIRIHLLTQTDASRSSRAPISPAEWVHVEIN